MSIEHFRDVEGYESLYRVSSQGRVLSYPKILSDGRYWPAQFIGARQPDGRNVVALHKDGQIKRYGVALLVARAFLGEANGRQVIRRDGNVSNDALSNLKYGKPGSSHSRKLRGGQVWEIRALLIAGEKKNHIAKKFGVTGMTIGHIARRMSWANLSVTSLNDLLNGSPQ
jgi:hypothetical protein